MEVSRANPVDEKTMVNEVIRTPIVKVMDVFAGSERGKFSLLRYAAVGERGRGGPKSLVTVDKGDHIVVKEENSRTNTCILHHSCL